MIPTKNLIEKFLSEEFSSEHGYSIKHEIKSGFSASKLTFFFNVFYYNQSYAKLWNYESSGSIVSVWINNQNMYPTVYRIDLKEPDSLDRIVDLIKKLAEV